MALSSITSIFGDSLQNSYHYSRYKSRSPHASKSAYMIIPLFQETFEIPVIALSDFICLCSTDNNTYDDITSTSAICINLISEGYTSTYASISSKVRDCIGISYKEDKLIILKTKEHHTYYITNGAIFNSDLKPLLILSWQIKRIKPEDSDYRYQFIRPILRIDPIVYINKDDELQKFIVNKIMPEVLLINAVYPPYIRNDNSILIANNYERTFTIKIEIDENPFKIIATDKPSVSTTNKELLDTAITYVDEMIQ